uniref:Uncharacterized protein n=1 Tax=Dicentrarchus labrax TaxID=13489 RepID=A0A8P4GI17_DICLA
YQKPGYLTSWSCIRPVSNWIFTRQMRGEMTDLCAQLYFVCVYTCLRTSRKSLASAGVVSRSLGSTPQTQFLGCDLFSFLIRYLCPLNVKKEEEKAPRKLSEPKGTSSDKSPKPKCKE